jgi:hypothetical protein
VDGVLSYKSFEFSTFKTEKEIDEVRVYGVDKSPSDAFGI